MNHLSAQNRRDADLLSVRYLGLDEDAFVAYVDESYRLITDCRPGEEPFYVMAAVLLSKDVHVGTREGLQEIAGPGPWHTTDRCQTPAGRESVSRMVGYLAAYQDACILAVSVLPGQHDTATSMRRACLAGLLVELGKPEPMPGVKGPIQLIVFEKQRETADLDRDRYTIRLARQAGHVGRHVYTMWVSPAVETLLWLPDLVSHTYYRYVTRGDQLARRLSNQAVTVRLPLNASDPLAAAARIQGVSPLFP